MENQRTVKREPSLGAIWKATARGNGQLYLKIQLEEDDGLGGVKVRHLVAFANNFKEKETHPDFRIYARREIDNEKSKTFRDSTAKNENTTSRNVDKEEAVSETDELRLPDEHGAEDEETAI